MLRHQLFIIIIIIIIIITTRDTRGVGANLPRRLAGQGR